MVLRVLSLDQTVHLLGLDVVLLESLLIPLLDFDQPLRLRLRVVGFKVPAGFVGMPGLDSVV